ncbi:hypothetical protein [Paenibacillus sp. NPDC058174]|uniref:hypothetical protein n=1 Tax=Paenibacillus sp. NPDC058174 TaxID=3346366 RepID=UPI0036DF415A
MLIGLEDTAKQAPLKNQRTAAPYPPAQRSGRDRRCGRESGLYSGNVCIFQPENPIAAFVSGVDCVIMVRDIEYGREGRVANND